MAHDFKNYPELTNNQMNIYYFVSPHKQITEDFEAIVTKVKDGDTISVRTDFRDFDFAVRLAETAAPEMNEEGGQASRQWLEDRILNETVTILVDKNNRVGKWGRILGQIILMGVNMNKQLINNGFATSWDDIHRNSLENFSIDIKRMEKLWR